MLIKGLVFTALVASTPIALTITQDPKPVTTERSTTERQRVENEARNAQRELAKVRRELEAARGELETLRQQLEHALDALDQTVEPQRERNCSPSRGRAMMSHYQWLQQQGHQERAANALVKVVDQAGQKPERLNSAAWSLMTDKETAGKFDEVALAFVQRMEQSGDELPHQCLDTAALAHFLNGGLDRAIELQQAAIAKSDNQDYRRRMRTYEAARTAVTRAAGVPAVVTGATLVASNDDDD